MYSEQETHSSITPRKAQVMSLEQYLGSLGLSHPMSDFMDDKLKVPHGMTSKEEKRLQEDARRAAKDYHSRREEAIAQYNRLVEEGRITRPSAMMQLLRICAGHPDNEAVQAARRVLFKRYALVWTPTLASELGISLDLHS